MHDFCWVNRLALSYRHGVFMIDGTKKCQKINTDSRRRHFYQREAYRKYASDCRDTPLSFFHALKISDSALIAPSGLSYCLLTKVKHSPRPFRSLRKMSRMNNFKKSDLDRKIGLGEFPSFRFCEMVYWHGVKSYAGQT